MSPLDQILEHKIVAILRGVKKENVVAIAKALHAGGVNILEVTLNTPDALSQIELLTEELGKQMLIGAGTVLDKKDAKEASKAGAKFLISPIVDVDVIEKAKDLDLVSIPGAYTPTEVYQAFKAGGDIIKVFPVTNPDYIKALLAPLNKVRVMPTGGINAGNIKQFANAGAVAFGIGSALVNNADHIDDAYLSGLTAKATALVQAINH